MITHAILPQWLDDLIYNELNGKYQPCNSDMTVIDWDKPNVLNYLGTYFPRSYSEAYCIFNNFFDDNKNYFSNKEEISIFDFGSGTGGEIIGLLTIIEKSLPNVKKINVTAFDGNHHALRLYQKVFAKFCEITNNEMNSNVVPITIDDFYDLTILDSVLQKKYDIFISFKAICEFVTKQQFEENNPYEHIVRTFLPKLNDGGLMFLEDVTSCNMISQEWLPKMMDAGLRNVDCEIIARNDGFNQVYYISHSRRKNDVSKVAWRMIKNM